MKEVDIHEVTSNLNQLIDLAVGGEEVVILRDNHPIVKLVAVPSEKKCWPAKAGSAKGRVWMSDDFDEPLEEFKDYM